MLLIYLLYLLGVHLEMNKISCYHYFNVKDTIESFFFFFGILFDVLVLRHLNNYIFATRSEERRVGKEC